MIFFFLLVIFFIGKDFYRIRLGVDETFLCLNLDPILH
jgi:hypothetical protein